jgi:AcrR family transcriptional regulator
MTLVINDVKWRMLSGGGSMRVSKAQAAENRQQILTAAARLFRQRGVSATGVDAIAEDAGLTHGAVYSQFGSKEVIAAEAIRLALDRGSHLWQRIAQRKARFPPSSLDICRAPIATTPVAAASSPPSAAKSPASPNPFATP